MATFSKLDNAKKKQKILRILFILSFTIIPVVHFLLFYVYVNLDSFVMAFQKPNDTRTGLVFTWDNFDYIFKLFKEGSSFPEWDLKLAFGNTFKTFLVQMIMYPIGLLVSYFIYKKIWGYKAYRVIFYLPTIISSVVVSYFFQELMSPTSSFFPELLYKITRTKGIVQNPLENPDFANQMVILNLVWLSFPGNLIIWGGTFSRIPDSVIESARIDGVSWIRELIQIILPLVWPTFVLTVTTSIAGIFGATGNVFLLTGGLNGTQTVSNWLYMRVQQAHDPLSNSYLYQASALGLILTVISCALAIFVRKVLNSRVEEIQY